MDFDKVKGIKHCIQYMR